MPQFLYSRKQDDYHRSFEAPLPGDKTALRNPPREYYPVRTDGGVRIEVPFKYLGDAALIDVSGDGDCTAHGRNPYIVFIRNGVQISESIMSQIAKPAEKGARLLLDHGVGQAVGQAMETSGVGAKIAGSVRNAVHGNIHSSMSSVGKAVGVSFETTQAAANLSSKTVAGVGRWAATKTVAAGISNVVGGVGVVSLALESDTTGEGASFYDQFYQGTAEDGNGVSFFIKGDAR